MTIQELRDFFAKSDYSVETKAAIEDIVKDATELTPGIVFQVKDVLQKEIDADFEVLGVDFAGDPKVQEIQKEYDTTLESIEKDLTDDMNFVESELGELDEIRKEVMAVSDEMEAEELKKTITS